MEMESVFLQVRMNVKMIEADYALWQQGRGVTVCQPHDIDDLLRYLGNADDPANLHKQFMRIDEYREFIFDGNKVRDKFQAQSGLRLVTRDSEFIEE